MPEISVSVSKRKAGYLLHALLQYLVNYGDSLSTSETTGTYFSVLNTRNALADYDH